MMTKVSSDLPVMEINGHVVTNIRIEQAYRGNYHLANLTHDWLKAMAEKCFKLWDCEMVGELPVFADILIFCKCVNLAISRFCGPSDTKTRNLYGLLFCCQTAGL